MWVSWGKLMQERELFTARRKHQAGVLAFELLKNQKVSARISGGASISAGWDWMGMIGVNLRGRESKAERYEWWSAYSKPAPAPPHGSFATFSLKNRWHVLHVNVPKPPHIQPSPLYCRYGWLINLAVVKFLKRVH